MIVEYHMPSNKRLFIVREGAAINFLLGSCPDQTMDVVFAEIVEGCKALTRGNLQPGTIHEVNIEALREIASAWLRLQS